MYRRNFVSAALLAMIAVTQPVLAAEPVKFATGVDATFLPLVIAVEKGFAKQRGLDATYKQFASGALSLEAVVSGDADIAMASEIAPRSRLWLAARIPQNSLASPPSARSTPQKISSEKAWRIQRARLANTSWTSTSRSIQLLQARSS
jgi:ABC-type nitrate/sulfonate/bicarbonate transport system substrate-binding protein